MMFNRPCQITLSRNSNIFNIKSLKLKDKRDRRSFAQTGLARSILSILSIASVNDQRNTSMKKKAPLTRNCCVSNSRLLEEID